jgi:hypothetical protein
MAVDELLPIHRDKITAIEILSCEKLKIGMPNAELG